MKQNFEHFLITRINIDWHISRPKTVQERNDPNFLSYRLDLFEQICLPSVIAQKNQNFKWLLLFDKNLPDSFQKRINDYLIKDKIISVYITDKNSCLETIKSTINEYFDSSKQYLITTNLDSDDALSDDFVTVIQNNFAHQQLEFINFPFGYLYRFEDEQLYLREWLTAPCHTLIETYKNFNTALSYSHASITRYKVKQIFTKPMWLMIAHGNNVRTSYDVSAAWQPISRLKNNFHIKFKLGNSSDNFHQNENIFKNIYKVIISKKSWDTPQVKLRKILNIVNPSIIRSLRKVTYSIKK
ncbi:hypothetical protein Cyast_2339 [Cyanobacterium stanieri PCC 7202]|uniref:Rhamnosyltransferase n=1 Tax=Cyanobacterium stanieri (strain ATCC 29140 / PCC 7202) TaxID=292563 RepID=K9YPA0_CYASC|nr:hypothetical protein Cyast_2339 [Cyanobacterium stanieri PCC 7202]